MKISIPLKLTSEWQKEFLEACTRNNLCCPNAAVDLADRISPEDIELGRLLGAVASESWRIGLEKGFELARDPQKILTPDPAEQADAAEQIANMTNDPRDIARAIAMRAGKPLK